MLRCPNFFTSIVYLLTFMTKLEKAYFSNAVRFPRSKYYKFEDFFRAGYHNSNYWNPLLQGFRYKTCVIKVAVVFTL